jgi:hypothetical protein
LTFLNGLDYPIAICKIEWTEIPAASGLDKPSRSNHDLVFSRLAEQPCLLDGQTVSACHIRTAAQDDI